MSGQSAEIRSAEIRPAEIRPAEIRPAEIRPAGILVGYDGSPGSDEALAWAVREARARGSVLTVCQVWQQGYPAPLMAAGAPDLAQQAGERVLARGIRRAQALLGPGEVRPLLTAGPAAAALCEHSASAQLVVVGSRGLGGLRGLLLGSVSSQVATYGAGLVVVVRGSWRGPGHGQGPVVVGTEGSAASAAAVEFAFEEAALRETWLLAVCALADAPGNLSGRDQIENHFDHLLGQAKKEHPEVVVRRHITDSSPRAALLTAAHDAQMLVVGARGLGGVRGMMLGSVSQVVLQHASCPVGVARPR
jgi:nucleotide-binding universal stress UspA family protein